ncbi:hypothetical protein [Dyella acidiphila]|uniref:Uncharacterized protein n=1 Tax=Dyella acidiphila TaxID=2775866 RepID=A0ABR9GDS4_9GAMM|nr:hypothetical protein [Dyella acidiphila]MBE1162197.1 hypothetical protein [Dyella acidiphila]
MSEASSKLADRAAVIMGPALATMFANASEHKTPVNMDWVERLSEISLNIAQALETKAEKRLSSEA